MKTVFLVFKDLYKKNLSSSKAKTNEDEKKPEFIHKICEFYYENLNKLQKCLSSCLLIEKLKKLQKLISKLSYTTHSLIVKGTDEEIQKFLQDKETQKLIESKEVIVVNDFPITLVKPVNEKVNINSVVEIKSDLTNHAFNTDKRTLRNAGIVGDNSGTTWGVRRLYPSPMWKDNYKGSGQLVCIADTGVDMNTQLTDNYSGQWLDMSGTNYSTPHDVNGHGTHVCGTVCGCDQSFYRISIAPQAKWMGLKVLNDNGSGSFSSFAEGCDIILDKCNRGEWKLPDVLNCSFGADIDSPYRNEFLEDSLNSLYNAGVFCCFAIGNNASTLCYPGNLPESFSVGAVDIKDQVPSWASHGVSVYSTITNRDNKPEVCQPGVSVLSCVPRSFSSGSIYRDLKGCKYCVWNGTSMATPHCAGAIILIKEYLKKNGKLNPDPSKTKEQIINIIKAYVLDRGAKGDDPTYGYGRIELGRIYTGLKSL